jgi:hypothetical protein
MASRVGAASPSRNWALCADLQSRKKEPSFESYRLVACVTKLSRFRHVNYYIYMIILI